MKISSPHSNAVIFRPTSLDPPIGIILTTAPSGKVSSALVFRLGPSVRAGLRWLIAKLPRSMPVPRIFRILSILLNAPMIPLLLASSGVRLIRVGREL